MLFSTITFSLAIIEMLIHVPFKGLSISDCFNFNAPDHSMGVYFFFLIFDTFLYFFLTIIFDKYGEIWYNRIGSNCNMVQLKCYKTYTSIKESFSSLLCYRNSNHVGNASENEVLLTLEESENFETNIEDNTSDFTMSCVMEPVSYEIGLRRVAVRAQNISKNYHFDKSPNKAYSKKKSRKAVVEYFSLELYDGEIFALLGHNNAGKTTTINMLSGIIPVDTGSVFIYDDKVKMGNTRIRRFISVCPQKNIFFKELSCMEHIIFFAGLRGIDIREGIKTLRKGVRYFEEVLLAKKELEEKRNEIATLLINSGGKLAQEEFLRILDNEKKFSCYGLSLFLDEKQEKMNMLNNLCETSIAVSTWNDILSMIEEVGLTEQLFCTPRCLSDGMKRRLWLVIALLGNPKILILDEPTSGLNSMDRQQIWKIIQNEKKSDRCIIVTTNYMEEADILADRKGIIVSGRICCLGTSDFLKYKFSINYSLEIVADSNSIKNKQRYIFECLLPFIKSMIPEATYDCEKSERLQHRVRRLKSTVLDYNETYFVFTLPVTSTDTFSFFFNKLEACKNELNICNYRLSLATLEDVFYEIGSLSMSRTEGVYPPLLKKTPKKDLENELFPYSDVHQTDQTFHSEKKAENVKWKIENETKTKNRCEMSKDTILEVETRAAKQPNLWNYLITYWDFLCQKKKLQLILQWDNVKAISRLRYLQIIRNKTHFHIDVILPILVLIGSFFINEDSPGYLNSLIFQEKTVPVMLNQYDFFLQSPIPFHIDSQLSEAQIKKAYQFLSFFPNEFRKKFIEVGSFELSVIAGSNNGNINFASDITNSFLAENKVNISYKKNNVNLSYDKYLLPLHSSIKFTNLNGQSLRNFFYQTRQNISRVNDYVFGLNFESKGTEVSGATTVSKEC
jgi:ABC-type multidrug transport system ATPase subunit